ncbi:protein SEMI-ROLLED LEAF 2 isoform X2 [Malania oleifera]|uniref:protein SEMI-ROLLED LEAF 2 isoform X2 n=1 Tax=Malania oleifera TaxID=397392 RepID=UPI0025ADE699|nr:protein SEMI-ROLLED LEAF 2 isoform X2 [Malania oleifera]XP_057960824.1 protein SEMI-ROLLED LEAF 2 isoform X2 [Malania oleifera]XP_057960825.1 protein SEMI-ROLLED LEAF 2 isoform X2 [Malania oleifera]
MGIVSRRIFPACGSMCVCCPALRSRSRQPVKRYKKLLAEIFPKSLDGPSSERKIVKLCEYAAKNPLRIPKIAKYLEERCYKELRCEHIKFINVVTEAYNKLLCLCKEQMAYFAVSLLNVVTELLDNSKQDAVQILGCQTLTKFIYCQADSTYTHNIENIVHRVCMLAQKSGEERQRCCLRAASLQCLSAMIWFMAEFSTIFVDFEKIVHVALDNYEVDTPGEDDERGEPHHNWVDEVVRCDGRGVAGVGNEHSPSCVIIRPRPEKKDPSLLTREEIETPKIWAQICLQRMAELAKESTTLRRVLDPMFVYFDTGKHWVSRQGLAMMVLSDMSYFVEATGNQQLILSSVIRHLDHKNVAHDPQVKSYVVQVAAALARQIRSGVVLAEIGFVSDLCRHLRKSLQATVESVGEQELSLNVSLQNSIDDCLLEIAKGIGDPRPLFDLMAVTLEKLPSVGIVSRATIGSLMVLAHTISLASISPHSQQMFPEALLVQLLKVMLHPDLETRVGAHQLFSALLIPVPNYPRHEVASMRSGYLYEPRRWRSATASAFASISALLEKLRREKDGNKLEKLGNAIQDECKERDIGEEELKQGRAHKNSSNFYKISSFIDRRTCFADAEPYILKFSEDQIAQLLSGLWIQAILPDNLPSNFEAIGHSFTLTLISSRFKNPNDNLVVCFFQLPLSLKNMALDLNNARQRSLLVLSIGMLTFAAKIYQIPNLNDLLKSLVPYDVDPYMGISDDLQLYLKAQMDVKQYGSFTDNQLATSLLFQLRNKIYESNGVILDILSKNLSSITELGVDDLAKQLSEVFTPDEAFMFGRHSVLDSDLVQMVSQFKQSLSFDGDIPTNSVGEDDTKSDSSIADVSHFIPRMPTTPSMSQMVSIGQLMESALEVAGQVAGSSVSTSPLPYRTMANHCEALGTVTKKKLSSWLTHETHYSRVTDKPFPALTAVLPADVLPADVQSAMKKRTSDGEAVRGEARQLEPWLAMRLPPASPFDNFLRAARY